MLRNGRALAAAIVLTLALGIGANTAIFTLVDSLLLQPLPFRDPGRLVAIWDNYHGIPKLGVSPAEYDEWARQTDLFDGIGRYRHVGTGRDMNLSGGTEPLRVRTTWASASLFRVLGNAPAAGRFLRESDASARVALMSYRLWLEKFGGDPKAIGRPVRLTTVAGSPALDSAQDFTLIGVLPPDFPLAPWADVWMPESQAADENTNPVRHAFGVVARLKPGVSERQAAARLASIGLRMQREHPATSGGFSFFVTSLQRDLEGNIRPALLMLFGAVTLVLLIACANVANLLLARSAARRHETAIRIALGASRGRIFRESLSESIAFALAGGAAGLLVAYAGVFFLPRLLPGDLLDPASLHMHWNTLGYSLLISFVTAALAGASPALEAARQDLNHCLRENAPAVPRRSRWDRSALVIGEFALAFLLCLGAGLFLRSFERLVHVDPGFRPDQVLTLRFTLPSHSYPDDARQHAFFERLQTQLKALPGVKSVAVANALPLGSTRGNTIRFAVPGSKAMRADVLPMAQNSLATPDFFATLGIPVIAGRTYKPGDQGQPYVIVNQSLARTFWPGESAVGKRLITGPWGPKPAWSTVIGVVGDVKQFGLDSEHTNDFYTLWYGGSYLAIRTSTDPLALGPAVRKTIHALDPAIPVFDLASMQQIVNASSHARRFTSILLSMFAAIALALAMLGIYSVISWSVEQRRREIGVRMALGAEPRGIVGLILARGLRLSLIGLLIGLVGLLAAMRLLGSLLFEISPHDPWAIFGAATLMLAVSAMACYLPARRASNVDPLETLRAE